jgi:hypothetical protein
MKNHKLLTPLVLALGLAAATVSAQTAADNDVAQGRADLLTHNQAGLAGAYSNFNAAVTLSPTNETANALLAVTRLLLLPQQPAGSNFLTGLGFAAGGRNPYDWTSAPPKDTNGDSILPAENSSVAIAYVRNTVVPALGASFTNLSRITDPAFTLALTPDETSQEAVTVDYGDILLMQAEVEAAEFLGYTLNAQNFDVVARTLQTQAQTNGLTLQTVLTEYPGLLTHNSAADLANSQAALSTAIACYQAASAFIRNQRITGQGLFVLGADEAAPEAAFRTDLTNVLLSLKGPVQFSPNAAYSLDLSNYFSGAKSLRSLAPQFNGDDYVRDSAPDYTFGGILAGEPAYAVESFLRQKFEKHDYSGIYTGQVSDSQGYSGQNGNSFAVFVGTNQQLTVVGFDAGQSLGLFAQCGLDKHGNGQFISSAFTGFASVWQGQCYVEFDYTNESNELQVYLDGGVQSPLGDYQGGAGYYSGTYSGSSPGALKAILAPDGELFFAPLTGGVANDGGVAEMEAGNTFFGVSVNDTAVLGNYHANTLTLTGSYETGYDDGGDGGVSTIDAGGDSGVSGVSITDLGGVETSGFTTTSAPIEVFTADAHPDLQRAASASANTFTLSRLESVPFDAVPVISKPPVSTTVAAGSQAMFSVTATGGVTLGYQWYCNGQAISGATSSSLILSNVSPALNDYQYSVSVENVAGTAQASAVLTVTDKVKPILSNLNLTPNQVVNPSEFTVTGSASNAFGVSAVWYQLNNGDWTLAATTNNWTNWSAALSLVTGTNTLRTYAADLNSDGLLYVADANNNLIRKITQAGGVSTLAGDIDDLTNGNGNAGYAEGTGTNAWFNFPNSTATDGAGNIYVADTYNNLIRKITPAGVVTTLAGDTYDLTNGGYTGGPNAANAGYADGTNAQFNYPSGIATDASGNVYVADTYNELIRKITPAGVVTTLAGDTYDLTNGGYNTEASIGYADGPGAAAKFDFPADVSVDASGNVYVADANNNLIREITPAGVVATLAGDTHALTNGGYNEGENMSDAGYADGPGTNALFNVPLSTSVDLSGNVYVADYYNNLIRKITPAGVVTTLAGDTYALTNGGYSGGTSAANAGYADGVGAGAQFNFPVSTAVNDYGMVFVTDYYNELIRKITPAGVVTTLAGDTYALTNGGYSGGSNAGDAGYSDGPGSNAMFSAPFGIAADGSGGNFSLTNTVIFDHLVSALLTVQLNPPGWGTLSTNWNNADLAVGQPYTLTAKTNKGFAFVNWTTNSVPATTSPTLTFIMASNLVLAANFADVTPPTVAITNVPAGLVVGSPAFTVKGTAGDNVTVSNVLCTVNGISVATTALDGSWSNWTASVTLNPGMNTILAQAVGTGGLSSPMATNKVDYVVSALLTVLTNQPGWGTLSANWNNTLLAVGQNYTITAKTNKGFGFVNWTTNSVPATTSPTLTFTMASGLALAANFRDVTPPTVAITNVPAGLVAGSAAFTVKGTAGDNVTVSNVLCTVNGVPAATTTVNNNWSNWTASVTLSPGTNTILAQAVGTGGLTSPTVTNKVDYVVSALLTVLTNQPGWGTLSTNYNNTLLALNQNYTLTAKTNKGFAFVNWTSNSVLATTSPTLTFPMVTNLVLAANFRDVTPPTVAITNAPAGLVVGSAAFTVKGTAGDNVTVSNVLCTVNGVPAATTDLNGSWSNWTASVTLTPGQNTILAQAVGTGGLTSPTVTNKVDYVVSALLTVVTNQPGWGTLSTNWNNADLAVGQNYTLTARTNKGFAFVNWTSNSVLATTLPTLTFTMVPNLVLAANFRDVTPPSVAITNLNASGVLSNSVYTVMGTATDNVAVAGVNYQLNGGGWQPASTGDGWTNWYTPVLALMSGTNTVQAFAVDTAGNFSATQTVRFVNLQVDPAPASLAGLVATVTPGDGSVLTVGFSTNTFSQSATDTNNNFTVGTYVYAKLGTTTAQLMLTNSVPPATDGSGATTVNLTFSSYGTGTFSNANNGNSGGISFAASASLPPAAVAGTTALFISDGGVTKVVFGTRTLTKTGSDGQVQTNNYAYQPCSPVGGLLTIVETNLDTNYLVASFLATNHGLFYRSSYDSGGNLLNEVYGGFVFPSASPVAPASLNGYEARTTRGDLSTTTVGFDASTFSMTASDTNHDTDVGDYTYSKLNTTNAQLTLTVTAPPSATTNGGTLYLTFVADNFCLFTNQDNGSNGISGLGLKTVTNLPPSTLAGSTSYSTNNLSGEVDVTAFSSSGNTFTQSWTNFQNSGTNGGTYTYTPYSPIGALIRLNYATGDNAGATVYIQTTFSQTQAGTYLSTSYDSAGDRLYISAGVFSVH